MGKRDNLPPGYRKVAPSVFVGPLAKVGPGVWRGVVRVVVGTPPDDEALPEDERHNCGAMGCRLDHVLSRDVLDRVVLWRGDDLPPQYVALAAGGSRG